MLVDRRDRRPILLANARVMDPSRDLDFPGDILIADGTIRDVAISYPLDLTTQMLEYSGRKK